VLATHTDAIQIPDNPNARIHMTPLAASSILLKHGIEAIAQLSCRDRNRVALENELLSLGAMGVRNLLLLRGDDLSEDHRPRLKQVFEFKGRDLIEAARALAVDPTVTCVPDFCIGTVATVFNPKVGWKPQSLLAKVDAGARFIQTQLCFDIPALKRYMSHLIEAQLTWRCAIIVSVATLPSANSARWVRENLRGALVPNKMIRRLQQARDPEQEGVTICAELDNSLMPATCITTISARWPRCQTIGGTGSMKQPTNRKPYLVKSRLMLPKTWQSPQVGVGTILKGTGSRATAP